MSDSRKPRMSLTLPAFGNFFRNDEFRQLLDLARAADAAGIDGLKLNEHIVMGRDTSDYLWGPFPYPSDVPWLEPLATIAAMSAVTERLRFETGVVIAPLRAPVLLAKQAATIDVLSGGRLVLGVGTGWQPAEFQALGVPFDERGPRMTEAIAACRVLWRDSPASFAGKFVKFDEIWCEPRPLRGKVPVWFAGPLHDKTLERVLDLGDGWLPIMGATKDEIAHDVERLRAAWTAKGRDVGELEIAVPAPIVRDDDGPNLELTLESARALGEVGVGCVALLADAFVRDGTEAISWIEDVARRWRAR